MYINTANPDLEKNGWELLVNEQKPLPQAKPGDMVKLVIVAVSPMDYEATEIRSVNHITLWVEIEKEEADGFVGKLKTKPGHDIKMKDGTQFRMGLEISFRKENIFAIR